MDRQRRLRLVQVLKSKDGALVSPPSTSFVPPSSPNPQPQPATTPTTPTTQASPHPLPSSPPPIVVVPLALVEVGASSAPLEKGKRVVEVVSDDEDSTERQVFKRQRTQHAPQMVTSATSSSHRAESLREDPPSATSPPQSVHQERGFEAEPVGVLPPAPELPLPMQESLRGFLSMGSTGSQTEEPQRESMYYYMGLFMSCAYTWHKQSRAKTAQASAFQALEKEVASLKEGKERLAAHWGRQEGAYKESLRVAQKAREEANKRLHEVAQAQAGLLNEVVPLRTKIADLEATAETSKAYQKKLEDQCMDREQKLGKTEVALANKNDECSQLTTENASLQAKVQELTSALAPLQAKIQELTSALASKEQEMTAQATNFKVAEEKLIGEAATGFADGFVEALVQAACANPGIDVSGCSPFNEVVNGKLVPLEASEE
ncbi:eisosome protein 1-like [Phaseolus vulgaris]|uniref:eisosome protein 1-like n=1 Tax=Phaseolus vulgaris TaxID=3885 RepID=UPI0035CC185A